MIGAKAVLVAATRQKIVDSSKGTGPRSAFVLSALTDVVIGGPAVTSATGCLIADLDPAVLIPCGNDDLWAISATGGDVYVAYAENG